MYNKSNSGSTTSEQSLHTIGIGTADNARKNAFEVMKSGDIYVYGLGGYDGTNPVSASTLVGAFDGLNDLYVKLNPGTTEQTIKNTAANIGVGALEIWRATSGGYPMIGFSTGTSKTPLGKLGFGVTANVPIFRSTGNIDYNLWHAGNFNPANYVTIDTTQTVTGSKTFTADTRVTTNLLIGASASAQCHMQYDSDDECLKFIFD